MDAKSQLQQCCLTSREQGKAPDLPQYKWVQDQTAPVIRLPSSAELLGQVDTWCQLVSPEDCWTHVFHVVSVTQLWYLCRVLQNKGPAHHKYYAGEVWLKMVGVSELFLPLILVRNACRYKNLTESGDSAWKVTETQGRLINSWSSE